jgi:hypothetical protein
MVMPRYQRAGVALSGMPQITTIALQESARTNQSLAQQMDRVSNFAFRQAEVQAEVEGREYGALNAPTAQQLQDAVRSGQDVTKMLPGDQSTVFGRAARGTALDAISTQFELEARKSIVDLQAQFENGDIGLDDLETNMSALVQQQTDIVRRINPIAAQKFSASVGVISNSAYLSAAKEQAKRNRADYKIQVSSQLDVLTRNAETIVRAGPTISEDGSIITVDEKINTLRDQIAFAAQELDDPEFYNAKIGELDAAVTQAKIGVVMDEALEAPAAALNILSGNGSFQDPEVQATFASMTNQDRRELLTQVQDALSKRFSLESASDASMTRKRGQRSAELQAQITGFQLNGDLENAQASLEELRIVDPSAWESKSLALTTTPGVDNAEVVQGLQRLSTNRQLTMQLIDDAYAAGNLTTSTYKSFMNDISQQRNQKYNKAVDWLKSNRGVPEGTVLNFNLVQQAADREVAQIKVELLEALNEDQSIDPFKFVQDRVKELEEEGSSGRNAALRSQAQSVAEELRVLMPGASAQQLLERLQTDPSFYPNEQRRNNAIDNLLPILIDLEANNNG